MEPTRATTTIREGFARDRRFPFEAVRPFPRVAIAAQPWVCEACCVPTAVGGLEGAVRHQTRIVREL